MQCIGGGAPASRYSCGTGTHPPPVTETILSAWRARCRLTDTTFGSAPRRRAASSRLARPSDQVERLTGVVNVARPQVRAGTVDQTTLRCSCSLRCVRETSDAPTGLADVMALPTMSAVQLPRLLVEIGPPLAIAVLFLGPGLAPGALMNLDMIVLPDMSVPTGFWGLGPEFPRRVPLWLPITAMSSIVPATVTTKVLFITIFVVGWCGMSRWARSMGVGHPAVAAGLYVLSPFLLTRLAVGHVGIVLAAAILPWVARRLLTPAIDLRRTFLAATVLALCGYAGGVIALVVVCAGVVSTAPTPRRALAAIGTALLAQTPWLVPAVLVTLSVSADAAVASPFGVQVGGHPLQVLSLSAGNGYWNSYFQIGPRGWTSAVVGAVLLSLAVYGSRRLPRNLRPVMVLGLASWILSTMSASPRFDDLFDWLTGSVVGGLLRDPQRFMTLHLFWMAPAACLGADRLREHLTRHRAGRAWAGGVQVLPAAAVLVVSTPGLWGLGGHMSAVPVPPAWDATRELVQRAPGPTLALPWAQYLNQDLPGAPVRRVLNPIPYLLGGDVISSSDNRLGDEVQEVGDPREPVVADALAAMIEDDTHVATVLSRLGVRWVVLQTTTALADRYGALRDDPGLELVLEGDELTVWSVRGWDGLAVDGRGRPIPVSTVGGVVYRLRGEGSGPALLARPGSGGWMQGWSPTSTTVDGLLELPRARGVVWNVATPLNLAAQAAFVVAVGWLFLQLRRDGSLVKRSEPV
jgi:hypothetical protein